jgi:hypothetical protein
MLYLWDMINLRTILNDYVAFIKLFEATLKEKYGVKTNPYLNVGVPGLINRTGVIGGYEYRYHGLGCEIRYQDIICDYSIVPDQGTEIQFSIWALSQFIKTNLKYSDYAVNEKVLKDHIKDLVKKGVLSMLEIDGRVFEAYLILNAA